MFPIAANSLRSCFRSFPYRLDIQASIFTGLLSIDGHSKAPAPQNNTPVKTHTTIVNNLRQVISPKMVSHDVLSHHSLPEEQKAKPVFASTAPTHPKKVSSRTTEPTISACPPRYHLFFFIFLQDSAGTGNLRVGHFKSEKGNQFILHRELPVKRVKFLIA